jgi:signal transduction histidine kinase/CHASE2 domain-containing sensor protein
MLVIIGGDFFSALRQSSKYLLFTGEHLSEKVMIVAIDDASLQAFGRAPTEWTRDEYIPVIDTLSQAGARVIAIDLLLPEPAPGDVALAAAIERARLSEARTRFVLAASGGGSVHPVTIATQGASARFQARLSPVTRLLNVVDYVGYTNVIIDSSGNLCCQLSHVMIGSQGALSFSLSTYLAYLRIPNAAREQVVYSRDDILYVTPERRLNVDAYGQWIQNYNAPPEQGFPTLSFVDVYEGEADLSLVRDRIVLIGLHRAVGSVDTYRVPVSLTGAEMSGVEIQANAVDTLIRGNALREFTRLEQLLVIAALALVSAVVYEYTKWVLRPVMFAVMVIVLVVTAAYLFTLQNTLFSIFDGILAVGLPLFVSVGIFINNEGRRRELAEFAVGIADREKRLLEDVILGTPAPMIILNRELELITVNYAFNSLLDAPVSLQPSPNLRLLDLLQEEGIGDEELNDLRTRFAKEQDFQTELVFRNRTYQSAASWLPRLNRWIVTWADVSVLTEMNEIKRHMLLMVSHDLRNPLSSLHLQLYQIKRLLGDSQSGITKTIEAAELSAKTMQHILSDVIDLEQVRTLTFPIEILDMEKIAQVVLDRYRSDAQQKEHNLALRIEPPIPKIRANEGHITQMLANLVSNAIKYTPANGSIIVRLATVNDKRIRLEVSDNGIGIPRDAQGKLFTEFYRVRSRATSEVPGTGLGLSLVKTIVRKNGGQIWFESQEGIGTTFYVEFPAALVEQPIA